MDSSTRVQFLTTGLQVNLGGDLSPEDRVKVMKYWIGHQRAVFQYLPIFRPLRERIVLSEESSPHRARGPVDDNVVGLLGSGIDGRLKVAALKCLHLLRDGNIELKTTILLDEQGRFLLEQVKLEVGPLGKGDVVREILRDYTGRPLDYAAVIQHENVSSFFEEVLLLIAGSLQRAGQDKVDWGNAMLHRADQMRERLGTAVRW